MPLDLDKSTIGKAIGGSLLAFLFYGHIETAATQKIHGTMLVQHDGELNDIWVKYNGGQEKFFNHAMKEMEYRLKQSEKWVEFYKEKSK